jgi:uncharacterized protein YacL
MNYRNILISSSILFVTASTLETLLHEGGHFIAAQLMAGSPTIYHNHVSYNLTDVSHHDIIAAAAGPLVSLLIGVLFHLIQMLRKPGGSTGLFLFYMSAFGYIGFFGYMLTAPFFTYGDTGFILKALSAPGWLINALAMLSALALYLIMGTLAPYVVSCMSSITAENRNSRMSFINQIITYPLIIGTIIETLLSIPVPTFLSLLAPILSPLTLIWPFGYYMKSNGAQDYYDEDESLASYINWGWLIPCIGLILLNRFLVGGFQF